MSSKKNKITLPSGAWVVLRDPTTIRVGDRKKVMAAADKAEGETSKALAIGDAVIAMLIEDWSFDMLIPNIRVESLDELQIPDYDALAEHTREAQNYLFPQLSDSPEAQANPDSPFDNSSDSNG